MGNKTVLLVEDNADDAALTLRAFRKNNIHNEIVVVQDGVEALDYLFCTSSYGDRDPDLPGLMLLDLKLPKMNGLEVLKCVRSDERTRLLPVVILTSSRERQDLIDGYSLGANSYIVKPVSFENFLEAVKQLGSYWLFWNEPIS